MDQYVHTKCDILVAMQPQTYGTRHFLLRLIVFKFIDHFFLCLFSISLEYQSYLLKMSRDINNRCTEYIFVFALRKMIHLLCDSFLNLSNK